MYATIWLAINWILVLLCFVWWCLRRVTSSHAFWSQLICYLDMRIALDVAWAVNLCVYRTHSNVPRFEGKIREKFAWNALLSVHRWYRGFCTPPFWPRRSKAKRVKMCQACVLQCRSSTTLAIQIRHEQQMLQWQLTWTCWSFRKSRKCEAKSCVILGLIEGKRWWAEC